MATFTVTDEFLTPFAGMASSVRYTVTDAGGTLRIASTNAGVMEVADFAGALNTGAYVIQFMANTAWAWPLRVWYTIQGIAGVGIPSTIGLPAAVMMALGYGDTRAAKLDNLDVAVSSRSIYAGTASPATSSTAAAWSTLASVYCTDEDIALRCLGDYPALCPDHQKLAAGTDGVFPSADRWKLTAATVDFTAAGVHAGNVVQLTAPRAQFRNDGELFIVESVGSDGAATLRRLGKGAGVGQPPAPAAGLTGVAFEVLTLDPQIEQATYEIQQWMGVDTTYPDRTPYDPRSLNLLCVLWVLQRMYALQARKREEDFGLKLEQIKEELEDLKGRLSIRWGPQGLSGRAGGVFGARAGR
jgi:hypothetical protein